VSGPRLLRAVRLDASDARVFPRAAAAGEWLVVASGLLAERLAGSSDARDRRAFASGFLGVDGLGFATFAQAAVLEGGTLGGAALGSEPLAALAERLADRLVERAGAPDRATALAAARALLAESAELAQGLPEGALLAVERTLDPATGALRERLRRVEPASPGLHARIWAIVPEAEAGSDG
jgi:hypothetical protein